METSNKTIIEYNDNNLCPVCYENIDLTKPESYIIFNCCNQMSHIDCIISWTNSAFSKTSKSNLRIKCIMCQEDNEMLYDIVITLNNYNNYNNYNNSINNGTNNSINNGTNNSINNSINNGTNNSTNNDTNNDTNSSNDLNEQNTSNFSDNYIPPIVCKIISNVIFCTCIVGIILIILF